MGFKHTHVAGIKNEMKVQTGLFWEDEDGLYGIDGVNTCITSIPHISVHGLCMLPHHLSRAQQFGAEHSKITNCICLQLPTSHPIVPKTVIGEKMKSNKNDLNHLPAGFNGKIMCSYGRPVR